MRHYSILRVFFPEIKFASSQVHQSQWQWPYPHFVSDTRPHRYLCVDRFQRSALSCFGSATGTLCHVSNMARGRGIFHFERCPIILRCHVRAVTAKGNGVASLRGGVLLEVLVVVAWGALGRMRAPRCSARVRLSGCATQRVRRTVFGPVILSIAMEPSRSGRIVNRRSGITPGDIARSIAMAVLLLLCG